MILIIGVRIIPEFDAPSHVGAGWQYPGAENFTVCFRQEPWYNYCAIFSCGQFNPMNEDIYPVLGQLYDELFDIFQFDSFHFGGDEVQFSCWNSTEEVTRPMQDQDIPITEDGISNYTLETLTVSQSQ